jgi:hypothetical protein
MSNPFGVFGGVPLNEPIFGGFNARTPLDEETISAEAFNVISRKLDEMMPDYHQLEIDYICERGGKINRMEITKNEDDSFSVKQSEVAFFSPPATNTFTWTKDRIKKFIKNFKCVVRAISYGLITDRWRESIWIPSYSEDARFDNMRNNKRNAANKIQKAFRGSRDYAAWKYHPSRLQEQGEFDNLSFGKRKKSESKYLSSLIR